MNILSFVHMRSISPPTGAGRVARCLVEAFSDLGRDDIRILADQRDHARAIRKLPESWRQFNYYLFRPDTSLQQRLWVSLERPKAEIFWDKVEIVYCLTESYVPTRKARLAVLAHDAAFFDKGGHRRDRGYYWQRAKWTILFHKLARKADMVQTVSSFSAERLAHHFPALKDRLVVVPNAVPDVFFEGDRAHDQPLLAELGLDEGVPFVLLPRGLAYRKNADLVLEAWPRLAELHPDLRLVVTSHNVPEYVERARAMGCRVILTGFVSDPTLRALYRNARVVWYPSRYEGFGIPVLEAMACGTPVVASDSSSLPEVIGKAGVMVPVDAPDSHVDALDAFLTDPSLRDAYRTKGLERAALYRWSNSAETARAALERLL